MQPFRLQCGFLLGSAPETLLRPAADLFAQLCGSSAQNTQSISSPPFLGLHENLSPDALAELPSLTLWGNSQASASAGDGSFCAAHQIRAKIFRPLLLPLLDRCPFGMGGTDVWNLDSFPERPAGLQPAERKGQRSEGRTRFCPGIRKGCNQCQITQQNRTCG